MTWKIRLVKHLVPNKKEDMGPSACRAFKHEIELPFLPYPGLIYADDTREPNLEEEFEEVVWIKSEGVFEVNCGLLEIDVARHKEVVEELLSRGWEPYEDEDDRPNDLESSLIS